MGEKAIIDDRRLIAVAPHRMPWPGGGVLDHGDLEALLEQVAQVGLDADVRQHAAEDDLADPPLAQLQREIVGLWPPHLVRADHDRLAVLDIRLEALQPIRAGKGYSLAEVTLPIRVLKLLGVRTLILTNAAGSLNTEFTPGTLMVISDHINLMGVNPLIGPNDERFGPRFPDLTATYAPELQNIVIEEARAIEVDMRRGVYAALSGPSYETPAEIHMVRTLGADAVGMSTVPEAIVARHMDMQVIGISCITNLAAGVSNRPIDHSQVMEIGKRVRAQFTELLRRVIARLG